VSARLRAAQPPAAALAVCAREALRRLAPFAGTAALQAAAVVVAQWPPAALASLLVVSATQQAVRCAVVLACLR